MRPRVGSRGSLTIAIVLANNPKTFNEAPSWFSGKWELRNKEDNSVIAFNEAPSWFSGKLNQQSQDLLRLEILQ